MKTNTNSRVKRITLIFEVQDISKIDEVLKKKMGAPVKASDIHELEVNELRETPIVKVSLHYRDKFSNALGNRF